MGEQPQVVTNLASRWRGYFRERYDDERLVQIATDAAVSAALRRASSEAAAQAGADAVNEARRHRQEPIKRDGTFAHVRPAPPGKIVGTARNVKRGYQWGTSFQILDFDLSRSGGLPPVAVQIRGLVLNGHIDEGDEIVIDTPQNDARFVQADRVFNRTRNSEVEAPKGASALFAHTEAAFGKGVARAHKGITIGVMVWVAAIFLLVVGGFVFISCESSQGPTAPAWFCEQANKTGVENPPGC